MQTNAEELLVGLKFFLTWPWKTQFARGFSFCVSSCYLSPRLGILISECEKMVKALVWNFDQGTTKAGFLFTFNYIYMHLFTLTNLGVSKSVPVRLDKYCFASSFAAGLESDEEGSKLGEVVCLGWSILKNVLFNSLTFQLLNKNWVTQWCVFGKIHLFLLFEGIWCFVYVFLLSCENQGAKMC